MAARLAKIYGPLGFVKPKRFIPKYIEEAVLVSKTLREVNFKPAKKIETRFDPFHENVQSIRDFMFYTSGEKIRSTNNSCIFKTEVCCDRSEPIITVSLADTNRKIIFKTTNLSVVELLQLFNKHVSALYVPEPVQEEKLTKSMSKASKPKKK